MDGRRFDGLTKALGANASRRRLLRGLAGGVGAALFGRRSAAAQDGGDGGDGGDVIIISCGSGFKPCRGRCIRNTQCCTSAECPFGGSCIDRFCRGGNPSPACARKTGQAANACASPLGGCGGDPRCFCGTTTEGGGVCVFANGQNPNCDRPCRTSRDCPLGVCVDVRNDPFNLCQCGESVDFACVAYSGLCNAGARGND